jgi:hypothetical protein
MLITEPYRRLQQELHENLRYGAACMKFAPTINRLIREYQPKTILDYGAGKRLLRTAILLGPKLSEYDPGIPEIAEPPSGLFDMVCCIDVLEHIEPECLESVIADISDRTGRFAFLTIHTGPAGKFLSDGRNAHLIQKPLSWWQGRLEPYFDRMEAAHVSEMTYSVIGWKA